MTNKNNITTLKLEKETKERMEKLREHKRETYDDIIRKIMYVLNTVREEPEKAKAILEFIDEKRKRMFETSFEASKKNIPQISGRARNEQSFEARQIRKINQTRAQSEQSDSLSNNSLQSNKNKKITNANREQEFKREKKQSPNKIKREIK